MALAQDLADLVEKTPASTCAPGPPSRPSSSGRMEATDDTVAAIRRTLLAEGRAVLGRAEADGRLWLKATLLNPHATPGDLAQLITLVEGSTHR